ncbi:tobe domain protein [Persephonella atlantica]|uniref:Tobe domain protein n=1 Tax=Persephonella atlantica TaxID=2699429 RepID=A0ABS1GIK1_9AQUI|nr:TOBE domain-containing protein [Persephonella atlantica]MBK3332763.1 tobe domain protein [Persephonella atlantica]
MNRIKGKITGIESSGSISLVDVDTPLGKLCAVIVETPSTADYLTVGNQIYVLFKETEVSIGKNLSGELSLRNKIPCIVEKVDKGKILSRVVLRCKDIRIKSIITSRSVERMAIKEGDNVVALIKTNEVSLMESDNGW